MRSKDFKIFPIILVFGILMVIQACSRDESDPRCPKGTGSATFSIQWPDSVLKQQNNLPSSASAITYIDCAALGVASIKATMPDFRGGYTDYEWPCINHSGTMNGLPARSGYTITVQAVNNAGKVLYEGQKSGITIVADQNTNIGVVSLEAVGTNGLTAIISAPSGPQTITAGQALNFQGSATGGTAPYTYQWNFGGGATNSSVQNPGNITFSTVGSYTVTLTVADYMGVTRTASVIVVVSSSTTYSISGTVSGAVSSGVTMTLSGTSIGTAATDASGTYSFTGLASGSYTVTPSLNGYTFTPTSLAVTVNGANAAAINFVNTPLDSFPFTDTFDSYTTGSFPSSGGWQIIYDGAGSSSQYVDNTHPVSGSQSLHLVGASCWSATIFHEVTIPSQVTLEANIFLDAIVSCGCTPGLADIGLYNTNLGSWGTAFGLVLFNCDGNIYAAQSTGDRTQDVLLMPYTAKTWYQVRLNIDLTNRTYNIVINGVLRSSAAVKILDSGSPTGVLLQAGHGSGPVVWFDDVKIY